MPESVDSPAPERTSTSLSESRSASASRAGSPVPGATVSRALTDPWCPLRAGRRRHGSAERPPPRSPVRAGLTRPRGNSGTGRTLGRPGRFAVLLVGDPEVLPQGPAVQEDLAVAEAAPSLEPAFEAGGPWAAQVAPATCPAKGGVAAERVDHAVDVAEDALAGPRLGQGLGEGGDVRLDVVRGADVH